MVMAIIRKKIWPEYFNAIQDGSKKFEIRLADSDIKEGDTLILEEFDPKKKEYTGRNMQKKCARVHKMDLAKFWTVEQIKKNGIYVIELG